MSEFIHNVQVRLKESSAGFFTLLFRVATGVLLGLTFSIAFQEVFKYGTFSFWFVIVAIAGLFLKVSQYWTAGGILVFNLFCILIGSLFRLYVVVAPGA